MAMDYPARRRLSLPSTVFGCELYANHFRCGTPSAAAPLVVFIGDALEAAAYMAMRHEIPTPVVASCMEAAARFDPPPNFDLLVFSAPPRNAPTHWGVTLDMTHHLLYELLPRTAVPHPPALALVGHGHGARLATCLALTIPAVRALCTLGGAELLEAVHQAGGNEGGLRQAAVFSADDATSTEASVHFAESLRQRGVPTRTEAQPMTEEGFAGYQANGAAARAFAMALETLIGQHASPLTSCRHSPEAVNTHLFD